MGYEFDILRLLVEIIHLLVGYPMEAGLLAFLAFLAAVSCKVLRFVLYGAANTVLSFVLTERVLKRLSPSDDPGDAETSVRRAEELARELGRREGAEEALREQLERERRRADRLEAELRESRQPRPWWRGLG
jgi:hypothetical protein